MKLIYFFFAILLLSSCKSQKNVSSNKQPLLQNINCPEGGDCTFEVLKNSSLQIKTDTFGKIYPEVVAGDHLVIKYHFKKEAEKNVADANYSEFVYFEIDKNTKQLILRDKDLQKVKMLFGRICFCRDAMGYFKVTEGNLFVINNNEFLQINSKFKVKKVPQIVTEIVENIKY